MVLLCFTHRDDLPVPFPSLVPNPHVPSGERVGSDDDTKPSLPPVLAVSKAEDSGTRLINKWVASSGWRKLAL